MRRVGSLWFVLGTAPAYAVEPHVWVSDTLPVPAGVGGTVWLDALTAAGMRVSGDFRSEMLTLHPYTLGTWQTAVHGEVVTAAGVADLRGTVEVTAVGPAESQVTVRSVSGGGLPAQVGWRKVVQDAGKKVHSAEGVQPTTPAEVQQTVQMGLTDAGACAWHLHALSESRDNSTPSLVMDARDDVAAPCVAGAIQLVLARATTATLREDAAHWFQTEWNRTGATAGLLTVLEEVGNLPAELVVLRDSIAAGEARERVRREAAEAAAARLPMVCADGFVDQSCQCGAPSSACCMYHGGVGHCLPPPP